ncbi:uncharacterized protein LOC135844882 [Planococcus citri]|uniref:uncharacterized protein LOC135844882 n=1 Tax=Planococcus citri TaxID=170843 RepID=UPI0031F835CA
MLRIFLFIPLIAAIQGAELSKKPARNNTGICSTDSSDFRRLSQNEKLFVDKTLFIKAVTLNSNQYLLITAPRLFGKTTNVNMLKWFYEIEVSENGIPLTKKDIFSNTTMVDDTPNYQLFQQRKLKIMENASDIVASHFGKYPVVLLDFQYHETIESYNAFINATLRAVHTAFKQHNYLENSPKLDELEKSYVKTWLHEEFYEHYSIDHRFIHVTKGCKKLLHYLHKHFGKDSVFLVDGYDAMVWKAMLNPTLDNTTIEKIVSIILRFLKDLFKDGDENHVERAIIVGISFITNQYTDLDFLQTYRFMQNNEFVDFFGFSSDDVDGLMNASRITSELRDSAKSYYEGYHYQGEKIFSPWSITRFLDHIEHKVDQYWVRTEPLFNFTTIFKKNKELFTLMEKLASNEIVKFPCERSLTPSALVILRIVLIIPQTTKINPYVQRIAMIFFLAHGYISIVEQDNNEIEGILPNEEIRSYLIEHIVREVQCGNETNNST